MNIFDLSFRMRSTSAVTKLSRSEEEKNAWKAGLFCNMIGFVALCVYVCVYGIS